MAPYCSSEVDGHQWVRGQEEVVESQGVFEFWEHVAEPCDEPWQCKDGPHLGSDRKGKYAVWKTKFPSGGVYSVKTGFDPWIKNLKMGMGKSKDTTRYVPALNFFF